MKLSDFTGLGRAVDLTYPTNQAIAFLCAVALLCGGFGAALTIFFAWALARELDPDHDLAAFVGVVLAGVAMSVWGVPSGGPLFLFLLGMRVVNGTTGLRPKLMDWLVLGALTVQAIWSPPTGTPDARAVAAAVALTLAFVPLSRSCRKLESRCDAGQPLQPTRVQAAQLLALLAGTGLAALGGWPGFYSLLAFWSAVAGTAVSHAYPRPQTAP